MKLTDQQRTALAEIARPAPVSLIEIATALTIPTAGAQATASSLVRHGLATKVRRWHPLHGNNVMTYTITDAGRQELL